MIKNRKSHPYPPCFFSFSVCLQSASAELIHALLGSCFCRALEGNPVTANRIIKMSGHSLLQTLLQATDFTRPPGPRLYRTPQPSVDYPKPDRSCHERESGGENAKSNFPTQGIDAESLPGSFLSTLVPCAAASSAIQVLFGILSVIYQTEKGYDLAGGVGFYTALATGFVVPVLRRRERERLVAEASSGHRHTKGDAKEYNWNALSLKRDWDWRQLALTGSTFVWAFRGKFLPS